jgi:hypothetical protein
LTYRKNTDAELTFFPVFQHSGFYLRQPRSPDFPITCLFIKKYIHGVPCRE